MLPNLTLLVVLALAPIDAYNRGNQLYAQKDYAGAALAYEQALKAGPSADAHYNLGNALFKSGKIGAAILHYRRAHFLDPRDADIRANLAFARSYRVDKVLTVASPPARALDDAFHWLSRREATLLAGVLFTLAALSLAAWITWRWTACLVAVPLLSSLALFGFITQQVWTSEVKARPAVVVAPEVNVLSGPSEESKQILLLHDGTEVGIREVRGAYLLVQVPGGSGGWIPEHSIARIF